MRYFVGLISMLALSVMPVLACTDGGEDAGTGGDGGGAGMGGVGGMVTGGPSCEPQEQSCVDGAIEAHTPCCEQAVPDLVDACTGTESTVNPATCEATGTVVTHTLTLMETAESCNTGFDLDGCDGLTCVPGGLAPFEGMNGVDNGLTGLAPTFDEIGGNLGRVNQVFADALCGLADDLEAGVCEDDSACTADADCAGIGDGTCNLGDDDCALEVPRLTLTFEVDANLDENCANVLITSTGTCDEASGNTGEACTSDDVCRNGACAGGGTSTAIINLSDATTAGTLCASGTLGTIPMSIMGEPLVFGNVVVRATMSQDDGFSGLVGSTVDGAAAWTILQRLLGIASAVAVTLSDISADLTHDNSAACNALSTGLVVGGTAARVF